MNKSCVICTTSDETPDNKLVKSCNCNMWKHQLCLLDWIRINGYTCEICLTKYETITVNQRNIYKFWYNFFIILGISLIALFLLVSIPDIFYPNKIFVICIYVFKHTIGVIYKITLFVYKDNKLSLLTYTNKQIWYIFYGNLVFIIWINLCSTISAIYLFIYQDTDELKPIFALTTIVVNSIYMIGHKHDNFNDKNKILDSHTYLCFFCEFIIIMLNNIPFCLGTGFHKVAFIWIGIIYLINILDSLIRLIFLKSLIPIWTNVYYIGFPISYIITIIDNQSQYDNIVYKVIIFVCFTYTVIIMLITAIFICMTKIAIKSERTQNIVILPVNRIRN